MNKELKNRYGCILNNGHGSLNNRVLFYKNCEIATTRHIRNDYMNAYHEPITDADCKLFLDSIEMELLNCLSEQECTITFEERGNFTPTMTPDVATVNYIKSYEYGEICLGYLYNCMTDQVGKLALCFIGSASSGKSTYINKIFKDALTITSHLGDTKYGVADKMSKFNTENSHLAKLMVMDDFANTEGSYAWQTKFKSFTGSDIRTFEYKNKTAFEGYAPAGYIVALNSPFYITQEDKEPILNKRMGILPFKPRDFSNDDSFYKTKLDRNTLLTLVKNCGEFDKGMIQEPAISKELKSKGFNGRPNSLENDTGVGDKEQYIIAPVPRAKN